MLQAISFKQFEVIEEKKESSFLYSLFRIFNLWGYHNNVCEVLTNFLYPKRLRLAYLSSFEQEFLLVL